VTTRWRSTTANSSSPAHRLVSISRLIRTWMAACHADWISKQVDQLIAHHQKLQEEDRTLEADTKELETALDYHTVENRQKRKAMQEKRNQLAQRMPLIAQNAQKGTQAMEQLLQSVESGLDLVKHAETWEWKEVETNPEKEIAKTHGADRYRFTKDWSDHKTGEIVAGVDLGDGVTSVRLAAPGFRESRWRVEDFSESLLGRI
jgi:DNA anti-recombination protein RmuC